MWKHIQHLTEIVLLEVIDEFESLQLRRASVGMTQDERSKLSALANIDVKIREAGKYRDIKWLSTGWRDLVGICMRFAIVDAMYEGEKPFLVLDDPFVNLDEEKVRKGMEILKEATKHY